MLGLATIYARHLGGCTLREWFTGSQVTVSPWDLEVLSHRRATPGLQRGPRGLGPAGSRLPQAGVWFTSEDAQQLSLDTVM